MVPDFVPDLISCILYMANTTYISVWFLSLKEATRKMWFWVRKSSWSRWTDTEVHTKDLFRVQPPTSASGHIPDAFHRVSWVFFSSEKEGDHHTHVLCQAAFFHPVFISPFLVYIHLKAEVKLRLSWQPGLLSVAPGKPLSESTTSLDTLRGQWPLLGVFSKKILWKHFPDIPWNLQQPLAPRLSGSKVIISTCNGPSQLPCLAFLQLFFRST